MALLGMLAHLKILRQGGWHLVSSSCWFEVSEEELEGANQHTAELVVNSEQWEGEQQLLYSDALH